MAEANLPFLPFSSLTFLFVFPVNFSVKQVKQKPLEVCIT